MGNRKSAFITILTTEDFAIGVEVVFRSLRRYSDREFVVLVNSIITRATVKHLSELGIVVYQAEEIPLEACNLSSKMLNDRWFRTLFKLRVFGLGQYDFLVYLDSDLLICGNIDCLLDENDFNAVSDRLFMPGYGRDGINAGLMCIRPSKNLEEELIRLIPVVAGKKDIFGDQDVINEYYHDFDINNCLGVEYNTCFYELEKYGEITPLVVHFILEKKPWMWSRTTLWLKKVKYRLSGKKRQIKYLNHYFRVFREID